MGYDNQMPGQQTQSDEPLFAVYETVSSNVTQGPANTSLHPQS
jgi:hypothetical protein